MGPMHGGLMEMHVQRHDEHDQGHLTAEGHEHARQLAAETINTYLDANPDTHFLVISSDQLWDDREPDLGGMRARETALDITSTINDSLEERGLPEDHLYKLDGEEVTTNPILREADIFSNEFMKHLRDEYPDENAWSMYYQDTDAETRKESGAESPYDLATRMDYMIKMAEVVGTSLHAQEGKEATPLLVWIVGHGGGLDSYLHNFADVPIDELGFGFSGGFTLKASPEHGIVADVKGKEYPLKTDGAMRLPE